MQIIISRKSPNDLQQQRLPRQAPISISGERGGWEFPSCRQGWAQGAGTSSRKVPGWGSLCLQKLFIQPIRSQTWTELQFLGALQAQHRGSSCRIAPLLAVCQERDLSPVPSHPRDIRPLLSLLMPPATFKPVFQQCTSTVMLLPKTQ